MQSGLIRYLRLGAVVELIYIDRNGWITKRKEKLISLSGAKVQVYCYARKAPRSLTLENVLAIGPIQKRKAV